MNSQKGIVGCLLLACTLQMSAQVKTYKYRVNFRDKAETTYALDKPSAYLSERALERRMKQGLPVDSTDIPVCRSYIDMLVGKGAQLVSKSKWNNTVVVQVLLNIWFGLVSSIISNPPPKSSRGRANI